MAAFHRPPTALPTDMDVRHIKVEGGPDTVVTLHGRAGSPAEGTWRPVLAQAAPSTGWHLNRTGTAEGWQADAPTGFNQGRTLADGLRTPGDGRIAWDALEVSGTDPNARVFAVGTRRVAGVAPGMPEREPAVRELQGDGTWLEVDPADIPAPQGPGARSQPTGRRLMTRARPTAQAGNPTLDEPESDEIRPGGGGVRVLRSGPGQRDLRAGSLYDLGSGQNPVDQARSFADGSSLNVMPGGPAQAMPGRKRPGLAVLGRVFKAGLQTAGVGAALLGGAIVAASLGAPIGMAASVVYAGTAAFGLMKVVGLVRQGPQGNQIRPGSAGPDPGRPDLRQGPGQGPTRPLRPEESEGTSRPQITPPRPTGPGFGGRR